MGGIEGLPDANAPDAPLIQLVKGTLHKGASLRELVVKARWRRKRGAVVETLVGTSDEPLEVFLSENENETNETKD